MDDALTTGLQYWTALQLATALFCFLLNINCLFVQMVMRLLLLLLLLCSLSAQWTCPLWPGAVHCAHSPAQCRDQESNQ